MERQYKIGKEMGTSIKDIKWTTLENGWRTLVNRRGELNEHIDRLEENRSVKICRDKETY